MYGAGGSALAQHKLSSLPGWTGDTQVMQLDLTELQFRRDRPFKREGQGKPCSDGYGFESRECGMWASRLWSKTTKLDVERFVDCWSVKKQNALRRELEHADGRKNMSAVTDIEVKEGVDQERLMP